MYDDQVKDKKSDCCTGNIRERSDEIPVSFPPVHGHLHMESGEEEDL